MRCSAIFLFLSGCIFTPGQPWGVANVSLDAVFAPDNTRLVDGRLITAKDYAVALDDVRVTFGELFLVQSSGGGALSFDPATPPPGFSLCHNGECHRDTGEIISYAEVEAELAGGTAAPTGLAVDVDFTTPLTNAPVVLPAACGDCVLERGTITLAQLDVVSVSVRGTAFDRRDDARLPEGGLPFEIDIPVGAPVVAELAIPVERFEAIDINLPLRFSLGVTLLDGIDFAESLDVNDSATRIIDGSTLEVRP
jgi:hypothetical protein